MIDSINDGTSTLVIAWINSEGPQQIYEALAPGGSVVIDTYLTHPRVVRAPMEWRCSSS